MAEIIQFPVQSTGKPSGTIDVSRVMASRATRQLTGATIKPAIGDTTVELADEHAAEPIKSLETINRITKYLIDNKRYRDNMLFVLGINFGLRISDLLSLQFFRLIDENCSFRMTFPILEKKTKNTRKVKKNRYITINNAVIEAVSLYLQHNECSMDDYLFRGESNRCGKKNKPMKRQSADRILKGIAEDLGLTERVSTHTLRKTFGYHQMQMAHNDPRKLVVLQKIFGHSSAAQTLEYIGITQEEIEESYLGLDLGFGRDYSVFGQIGETADTTETA